MSPRRGQTAHGMGVFCGTPSRESSGGLESHVIGGEQSRKEFVSGKSTIVNGAEAASVLYTHNNTR